MNNELHKLCNLAYGWYKFNENNRPYHNWEHALEVVSALPPNSSSALVLAAYWHDAVYVPGAGGDANEQCSAAALLNTASVYPNLAEVAAAAAELIRYTAIEYHFNENQIIGDLGDLLDADLYGLSTPYDEFVTRQDNIIREQHGSVPEARGECAEFLQNFLSCRPHLYHSDRGRTAWESAAIGSITRYTAQFAPVDQHSI